MTRLNNFDRLMLLYKKIKNTKQLKRYLKIFIDDHKLTKSESNMYEMKENEYILYDEGYRISFSYSKKILGSGTFKRYDDETAATPERDYIGVLDITTRQVNGHYIIFSTNNDYHPDKIERVFESCPNLLISYKNNNIVNNYSELFDYLFKVYKVPTHIQTEIDRFSYLDNLVPVRLGGTINE